MPTFWPNARPFVTDRQEETAILQVHFLPGGAAQILGLPASEIANAHLHLREIWRGAAIDLQ